MLLNTSKREQRQRTRRERVAGDAEAALGSLTWDDGLQTFLWYELPRKWLTDLEGKLHIAASLGRLLELVGLRYAAICRGPETVAVRQAYERSSREAFASSVGRRSAPGCGAAGPARRRCGSSGGR